MTTRGTLCCAHSIYATDVFVISFVFFQYIVYVNNCSATGGADTDPIISDEEDGVKEEGFVPGVG